MSGIRKQKKVKGYNVIVELKKIDRFFADLEKDKRLPSFGSFFMLCLILGIEEKVNLKIMYPAFYRKLCKKLKEHNATIKALQKVQ